MIALILALVFYVPIALIIALIMAVYYNSKY